VFESKDSKAIQKRSTIGTCCGKEGISPCDLASFLSSNLLNHSG
jgi:hypothetical protein